jgi:hypothetical protein
MVRAPVVLIAAADDAAAAALAERVRARGARVLVVTGDELAAGRSLTLAGADVVLDGRPLRPACVCVRPLGDEPPALLGRALAAWAMAGVAIVDAADGGDDLAAHLVGWTTRFPMPARRGRTPTPGSLLRRP